MFQLCSCAPQSHQLQNCVNLVPFSGLAIAKGKNPHVSKYGTTLSTTEFCTLQVSATDLDEGSNGIIRYEVVFGTGGADRKFRLDPDSGEIRTAADITESHSTSFLLSVRARDQPDVSSLSRYDSD